MIPWWYKEVLPYCHYYIGQWSVQDMIPITWRYDITIANYHVSIWPAGRVKSIVCSQLLCLSCFDDVMTFKCFSHIFTWSGVVKDSSYMHLHMHSKNNKQRFWVTITTIVLRTDFKPVCFCSFEVFASCGVPLLAATDSHGCRCSRANILYGRPYVGKFQRKVSCQSGCGRRQEHQ